MAAAAVAKSGGDPLARPGPERRSAPLRARRATSQRKDLFVLRTSNLRLAPGPAHRRAGRSRVVLKDDE
jgi:hypothetical protein